MNNLPAMNTPAPENHEKLVDDPVAQRGYSTSSEYVRELIRKDQDRQQLLSLLLAGTASAPGAPADAGYFEFLRDRVRNARG